MSKSNLTGIIVGLVILGTLCVSTTVFKVVRDWVASGDLPSFLVNSGDSPNVQYRRGQILPEWRGKERINILILGIDERGYERGPWRTDTMMIATLDPVTLQAGVLSIPRDLWVSIPEFKEARINTAHFYGDAHNYPGGGPALAMKTVEVNLGIPTQHYVRINFDGFIRFIDLIGGVDIVVEKEINDPTYPAYDNTGYDPLYIPAGEQHFDGELALKYVRTRHGSSDFSRARRQQQLIRAVLQKIKDPVVLAKLVPKAPEVFDIMGDTVQTDLTRDEVLALANLALKVDSETIRFGVIDEKCTSPFVTADGQQVLLPNMEKIREVRDYVFAVGETATPTPKSGSAAPQHEENVSIKVMNGTLTSGLATSTGEYLKKKGLNVVEMASADRGDYAQSRIIMNRPRPMTAKQIAALLKLPESAIVSADRPNAEFDIEIILGGDYTLPQP